MAGLRRDFEEGTHLYCFRPNGFANAIRRTSAHWPVSCVKAECFAASTDAPTADASVLPRTVAPGDMQGVSGVGFWIWIASTGAAFDVPNDKSVAQVLRNRGVEAETSSESGR